MKKQKKNSIARIIVRGLGEVVLALVIAIALLAVFAGAYLQESYKLNPPSEAERAECPWLVDFLAGKDSNSRTDERLIPRRSSSFYSPLFGIEGWRKPNELCRVATLLQLRKQRTGR